MFIFFNLPQINCSWNTKDKNDCNHSFNTSYFNEKSHFFILKNSGSTHVCCWNISENKLKNTSFRNRLIVWKFEIYQIFLLKKYVLSLDEILHWKKIRNCILLLKNILENRIPQIVFFSTTSYIILYLLYAFIIIILCVTCLVNKLLQYYTKISVSSRQCWSKSFCLTFR